MTILKAALLAVCALTIPLFGASAQTATISSFGASQADTYTGQILASDGNFYAVSAGGTAADFGCQVNMNDDCTYIDKITPSGTVTQLHTFERAPNDLTSPYDPNPIVEGPDGSFYGTTVYGGTGGCGTIFKLTQSGLFTVLYNFPGDLHGNCPNGVEPGPLTLGDDGNFYGVSETVSDGVLFYRVSTGGVFTVLSSGTLSTTGYPLLAAASTFISNSTLLQGSDSNYYVITSAGLLQLTSSGSATITHPYPYTGFSTQRVFPTGNLVEGPDGSFYSTSPYTTEDINGNTSGDGAIYKFAPGFGNIQTLHTISGGVDGNVVDPDLIFGSDGNLYGTTYYGGSSTGCPYNLHSSCGTLFQITPTGSFKTLYSFTGQPVDGERPIGRLVQDDSGSFFGTTFVNYGKGTFDVTLAPALAAPVQLSFAPSTVTANSPAVLTWNVLNAFSRTMQQCHATIQGSPSGAGIWSGPQLGSFVNNSSTIYTGTTTITPTVDGTYTYALTCGGVESGFATLKVSDLLNVPAALPNGVVGVAYNMPLSEFSGTPPYTTTITSGKLPAGLTLNAATGVLQGTPIQFGVSTLGLQVTDSASPQQTASGATVLTIKSNLTISNLSLSKGVVGSTYSQTLVATGGIKPYTWSLTAGTLPNGIKLDPVTGILSGKPTKMETQPLTLKVADSEGTPATTTVTLSLVVGPPDPIAAVEFTQAIQQYQVIGDLITSLNSTGGPPVPMITGKPAVMRVYFTEVTAATTVTLQVSGQVNQTQTLSLQPGCLPADQRAHNNGCPSMDFYFTPPPGTWAVVLTLNDATGSQLEQQALSVASRTTASIYLKGTIACDLNPPKVKQCGDPATLLSQTWMTSLLMPTASVTAAATGNTVQENAHTVGPYAYDFPAWDFSIAHQAHALYDSSDALADFTSNQWTVYFAVYSHVALGDTSGLSAGAPSHGAMGPDLSRDFGVDTTAQTVAHETGHTVSLLHTNVKVPVLATAKPGCFGSALVKAGTTSNWPYSTNNIQSSEGVLEYGFNVTTGAVIDPTNTYDLMSYCVPVWISPIQYNRAITLLNGGAVAPLPSPSVKFPVTAEARPMPRVSPPTVVNGPYWQIGGTIDPVAGVTFDPIFTETRAGSPDAGTGTYSIQVRGTGSQILYTRYFTPLDGEDDDVTAGSVFPNPSFSEWIPVTTGAVSIAVMDPNGILLSSVPLTGAAPTVTFTSPAAGFTGLNTQTISWTIQDPDSNAFTSRVQYSPDGGTTWMQVSQTPGTSDTVDFTQVPGSAAGLLRVYVSDGVHSGNATSAPFNVPKKVPSTIAIVTPATGAVQRASNPVYLSGGVYDADDGFLAGAALKWTDSVQGSLGTGSPLTVNMNPGPHTITLTGTDSDGNAIMATSQITLGGSGPNLTLTTNQLATNCINTTINASSGSQGVGLTGVNYSLDGGATYIAIPLTKLPFALVVPGSGTVNLVATAYDASGQSAAQSTQVSIPSACVQAKANPVLSWSIPAAIAYGTPLTAAQLNATASVAGTFAYSPVAGAVLPAGNQTLNVTFTPTDTIGYAGATGTATLSVTPVALTIVPANAVRPYGSSNPAFTFGATGFVNGDSGTAVTGAPVLNTSASITSAPGSYAITAAQGTLAAANYSFIFASGTLTVSKAASLTALQLSGASITVGSSESVTATLSSASSGIPTGTVTFLDGTTSLGSATLTNGQANFSTSSLALGVHTLSVTYSGDVDFAASSGSVSVTVNAVAAPDFTFASSGSNTQIVQPGQVASFSFAVAPTQGAYPSTVTFSVAGLPAGATAMFAPSSIAASSAAQTVTLSIQTQLQMALGGVYLEHRSLALALGFLLFPFTLLQRLRRTGRLPYGSSLLIAVIGLALAAGFSGCGGKGSATTSSPQSYPLTVTATSGSVQHTISMILTIQ